MLNWKRPENVAAIVNGCAQNPLIASGIVWNNHFSGLPPFKSGHDFVLVTPDCNVGLNGRFFAASMMERECVLIQDDDLELPPETVNRLHEAWKADPEIIHGLFGRRPSPDGSYNSRNAPAGECPIILTGALVVSRLNVYRMLIHLPDFAAIQAAGQPEGNGEDIIFSYVVRFYSGRMNRVHQLTAKPLPAPDAISRWPGYAKHRTCVVRACEDWLRRMVESKCR